jgi:dihydroxyacetone kinase-like predicted kinase
MASKRELIAQNLIDTLKNQTTYKFGLVTREPQQDIEGLAKTAFPCVVIESASESREDITQGATGIVRQSLADYSMIVYVMAGKRDLDTKRNEMIEVIEELLDADRSRGGQALYTELISVEAQDLLDQPFATMRLVVRVTYHYTRGQA